MGMKFYMTKSQIDEQMGRITLHREGTFYFDLDDMPDLKDPHYVIPICRVLGRIIREVGINVMERVHNAADIPQAVSEILRSKHYNGNNGWRYLPRAPSRILSAEGYRVENPAGRDTAELVPVKEKKRRR